MPTETRIALTHVLANDPRPHYIHQSTSPATAWPTRCSSACSARTARRSPATPPSSSR
ncbi:hypothetical protein ACFQX7_31065 [Luedemannella flava]